MLDVARTDGGRAADAPELRALWSFDFDDPVAAVAPSPDGSAVAVAFVEGTVAVLGARDGAMRWVRPAHAGGAQSVSWNAAGTVLASSGHDGHARLWSAADGEPLAALPGGAAWVARVAFEPGGDRVATAAGRRLRLWAADGTLAQEWPERSSTILDVAWRPRAAGLPLLAATSYGAVGLYDPRFSGKPAREFAWKGSSLALAWSPNARYLATGDQDSSVHFWITRSGRDLQMSGYPRKVRELAWHHSSRWLVTGGGCYPCVWDCGGRGPAGTTPGELHHHDEPVSALAYPRGGGLLASGALDGSVALWEPERSSDPVAARALDDEIVAIAWLPDDAAFVAATLGGRVACCAPPAA